MKIVAISNFIPFDSQEDSTSTRWKCGEHQLVRCYKIAQKLVSINLWPWVYCMYVTGPKPTFANFSKEQRKKHQGYLYFKSHYSKHVGFTDYLGVGCSYPLLQCCYSSHFWVWKCHRYVCTQSWVGLQQCWVRRIISSNPPISSSNVHFRSDSWRQFVKVNSGGRFRYTLD